MFFLGKLNTNATSGEGDGLLGLAQEKKVITFDGEKVITESNMCLTEALEDIMWGKVTVRYVISDDDIEDANHLMMLASEGITTHTGRGSADLSHRYSELTGYLWSEEKITVGGHDLMRTFCANSGKYLHLEVVVHVLS
jgi:hypothetical protein